MKKSYSIRRLTYTHRIILVNTRPIWTIIIPLHTKTNAIVPIRTLNCLSPITQRIGTIVWKLFGQMAP